MKRWLTLPLFALLLIAQTAAAVPAIQEARTNNGLRVLLMEAHNVPMVSMQLSVIAGSRFDAPGKAGTAAMLAAMLGDHTARHNHKAWSDVLDADAIQLGAGASQDEMSLSMTTLREALEPGLDLFAEALLMPGWDKTRFAILQQDSVAAARKELEEPGAQAATAAANLLFGTHPYGHRASGSAESLASIRIPDMQSLYKAQVKPDGAVLAVSGDITMAELLPLLNARLAGWQGKPAHSLMDLAIAADVHGKSADVALPTSQTLVELLRLGPSRADADFFPAFVLNHMLGGGGFGSRLMEEVREKRGLVYGVYSYFVPLAVPGPFVISLQTRGDQADKAEAVVREVLQQMAAGQITRQQLQASKDNLSGSFAQRMDSNRERVGLISMIGLYNLPLDYLSTWTAHVDAVTLDQVKAQAARFLKPDEWNRVRVGANLGSSHAK
ncbi:insulinase family protein [Mariprofundus erugo]|uniref:Insulinase family protein n=1 Tax=Mariprofundus erugo TaxID=2528639 RepID=A0A5R9GSY6_9PROT|nr:pitrilysin family protein [Mariprofundus erugo]TLS68708.1 insulinase family protein [Mariprofundus erugo]TLS77599.1 insulinase family protein [Mariprofundus erugo]